ncbi:hypothetical protein PAPYR_2484 [Paratrimastix pyriformis]|uniref:Uncharacterized protein n=1 Tax=Paratrimastix pyriformis TaxID=342808 RepID=A0ABQ8URT1_9EUKA|nr:hypothetical protein PAPYR_2484 [Paratrimastix pyriformis]
MTMRGTNNTSLSKQILDVFHAKTERELVQRIKRHRGPPKIVLFLDEVDALAPEQLDFFCQSSVQRLEKAIREHQSLLGPSDVSEGWTFPPDMDGPAIVVVGVSNEDLDLTGMYPTPEVMHFDPYSEERTAELIKKTITDLKLDIAPGAHRMLTKFVTQALNGDIRKGLEVTRQLAARAAGEESAQVTSAHVREEVATHSSSRGGKMAELEGLNTLEKQVLAVMLRLADDGKQAPTESDIRDLATRLRLPCRIGSCVDDCLKSLECSRFISMTVEKKKGRRFNSRICLLLQHQHLHIIFPVFAESRYRLVDQPLVQAVYGELASRLDKFRAPPCRRPHESAGVV